MFLVITMTDIMRTKRKLSEDFVNSLNDYCLAKIFTYLPMFDRLEIGKGDFRYI